MSFPKLGTVLSASSISLIVFLTPNAVFANKYPPPGFRCSQGYVPYQGLGGGWICIKSGSQMKQVTKEANSLKRLSDILLQMGGSTPQQTEQERIQQEQRNREIELENERIRVEQDRQENIKKACREYSDNEYQRLYVLWDEFQRTHNAPLSHGLSALDSSLYNYCLEFNRLRQGSGVAPSVQFSYVPRLSSIANTVLGSLFGSGRRSEESSRKYQPVPVSPVPGSSSLNPGKIGNYSYSDNQIDPDWLK